MKRTLLALLACALIVAPAQARVLQSQTKTYDAKGLQSVRVDFPVGELHVEGTDADQVTVKLYVHCDRHGAWCEDRAERVSLDVRPRGGRLDVDVDSHTLFHSDGFWIEGVVKVPRGLALDVNMKVGELEVRDMENDVDLAIKVGEVNLSMPETRVARVHAGVTIGEANLDHRGGHTQVAGLLGRRLNWTEGRGQARVDVRMGVGEVSVRLD